MRGCSVLTGSQGCWHSHEERGEKEADRKCDGGATGSRGCLLAGMVARQVEEVEEEVEEVEEVEAEQNKETLEVVMVG